MPECIIYLYSGILCFYLKSNRRSMKKRRKLHLIRAIAVECLILVVIGVLLFWGETRVMMRSAEKKLKIEAESIAANYEKNSEEIMSIADLYYSGLQAKADSLAFFVDNTEGLDEEALQDFRELYDVQEIKITSEEDIPQSKDYGYLTIYSSELSDGRYVSIITKNDEYNDLSLEFENGDNVLGRIFTSDFFIVLHEGVGMIMDCNDQNIYDNYYRISDLGFGAEDLSFDKGKWIKILDTRYYTYSCRFQAYGVDLTAVTGMTYSDMTRNSIICAGILFILITLIFSIIVAYSYACRQEEQRGNGLDGPYSRASVNKKLKIFTMVGLILVSATAYYVQSLFAMSMHSIEAESAKRKIVSSLDTNSTMSEGLQKIYNRQHITEAKIVSKIISYNPELRTKEKLAELSDIFGLDYIMMFDGEGREILSDSVIVDFVISDDEEAQSYPFNALKHGVSYVIQEPQINETTGEKTQFIGVPTNDTEGKYDGFLQICIPAETVQHVLEEISTDNTLFYSVSGSDSEIIAIEKDTGKIAYYSKDNSVAGRQAVDLGFSQDQIRSNYLGYITFSDQRLFADSFEAEGEYIYIVAPRDILFSGRPTMTIFTSFVTFIGMLIYTVFFYRKDVADPFWDGDDKHYVDVISADTTKRTLNVVSRVQNDRITWSNRTPEEKTALVIKIIVIEIGVLMSVAYLLRNKLFAENTIFGFIMSGRWNRGLNVFAITHALIIVSVFALVMMLLGRLLDLLVAVASPKSETVMRLLRSFVRYGCWLGMLYYCLSLFGFDSKSLMASAGILTLVVGLGAQDLITDILAGLFIIFENEFQVGDIIEVNGYKGRVVEIGIRTTRLMNTEQNIKSVNNRDVINVINKTRRNSYCDVIISVGFDQDINAIEAMLNEELPKLTEKCPYIISGPTYGGVDDMSGGDMQLSIRTECLEARKFEVRSFVNKEIKNLFDQYGFELG